MFILFFIVFLLLPEYSTAYDELAPGQTGWGKTVFQGTEADTFGIVIIGTTSTGASPSCHRILVRLTGQQAESTGIAAGMSGSPIYVGSELIGALSSTFPFLDEPLGLVTPLECMLDSDDYSGSGTVSEDVYHPLGFISPGFGVETIQDLIGEIGVTSGIVHSDIQSGRMNESAELNPGSPAAVVLVNGDWNLAALGTVTWRQGTNIAAFGHPFLGLGSVDLPLAGARITAVIPSRSLAFKIGDVGPVAGTVTFDGSNGIRATTEREPRLLPVHIRIGKTPGSTFQLGIAVHKVITPLLIRTVLLNCFNRTRYAGSENIRVGMNAYLGVHGTRSITQMDRGPQAPARISVGLGHLIDAMMNCPLGTVDIDSLSFMVVADSIPREHWMHSVDLLPGISTGRMDSIRLRIVTINTRGDQSTRTVALGVPAMISPAHMEIRIGDGPSTTEWERERAPLKHVASRIDEYLDLIFTPWRQDRLYIQILVNKGSLTRREGEIDALPGSMAKVLSRSVQAGTHDYNQRSVMSRAEIPFDGPVHGSVTLHPSRGDGEK